MQQRAGIFQLCHVKFKAHKQREKQADRLEAEVCQDQAQNAYRFLERSTEKLSSLQHKDPYHICFIILRFVTKYKELPDFVCVMQNAYDRLRLEPAVLFWQ